MYSNMASRQWFIGVKSNTDKQENRLRATTDFKSRRTKFAATVDRINLCENFVPPSAAAVRRVAAPYKEITKRIYSPLQRQSPLSYHAPPLAQIVKTECGVCGAG